MAHQFKTTDRYDKSKTGNTTIWTAYAARRATGTGVVERRSATGHSKADAETQLCQELKHDSNVNTKNVGVQFTVADFANAWLRMRTVEAKLRPTSLSAYKDAINGHTVLGLGAYRVKQLTARRIKEWLTGLHVGTREKPVSPATTKRARPILNELLELAKTAYCPP